ncbi:MAG: aminopeptidase P N-terminal domain-containing protein [Planctomycetota bacterium]
MVCRSLLTRSGLFAAVAVVGSAATLATQERRPTPPQPFFSWSGLDFPAEEYQRRRQGLLDELRQSGGGVLLAPSAEGRSHGATFRQSDDFFYFTGLELPQAFLVVDADAAGDAPSVSLFVPGTDKRFENPARRNDFPGRRLAADPELVARTGIDHVVFASRIHEHLRQWAEQGRLVRVNGGRPGALPPTEPAPLRDWGATHGLLDFLRREHPGLRIGNAFDDVAALRSVKSPAEVATMERACAITTAAIREAAAAIRDGVDERTLEGVLEAGFKRRGAQRRAFDSIIKSGPNSLWPWRILAAHYDRRNRPMRAGELVIFDVGCELNHYCSDVGRTFPVSGRFDARQRELVAMVTAVADAVIAAIEPGVTLAHLQGVATAAIPAVERRYMQTGLFFGHHIGLAVGDPASPGTPLEAGMVFTVEPWYYNHDEDVAVFVEDVVLVTQGGARNLTAALPRAPDQLEAMTAGAGAIRVMAYNVRHGRGVDDRVDLERIAAVIDAAAPDVVALQEIDCETGRTDHVDQARRLGALTGMHAIFGEFMNYDGGRYGMALLSRHPVEEVRNHRLPAGAEPRTALTARLRLAGTEQRLVVAGIHLYQTEGERTAQALALREALAEETAPVILAGDFNSVPGSPVLEVFDAGWDAAGKGGSRLTFPAQAPDREIDFILVPNDGTVEVVSCRVLDEPVASDHRPVLAELRLIR